MNAESRKAVTDKYSVYVQGDDLIADPVVSVLMWTYNERAYIEQAIESVLVQDEKISYELVISDDCSTDGTTEIIKEYQNRYPHKIRLVLSVKNIWKDGDITGRLLCQARGKYIALHHGDDYWTDPLKLQKQVDYLEIHTECSMCFHNVMIVYDHSIRPSNHFNTSEQKQINTTEDILRRNFIATCSAVFRGHIIKKLPAWYRILQIGDWPLWVLLAEEGMLAYLDVTMGCYRIHDHGIWTSKLPVSRAAIKLHNYEVVDAHLKYRYHQLILEMQDELIKVCSEGYVAALSPEIDNAEEFNVIREEIGKLKETGLSRSIRSHILASAILIRLLKHFREKDFKSARVLFWNLLIIRPQTFMQLWIIAIILELFLGSSMIGRLRQIKERLAC